MPQSEDPTQIQPAVPPTPPGGGNRGGGWDDDGGDDGGKRNPLIAIIAGALVVIVLLLAFVVFKGDGDDGRVESATPKATLTEQAPATTPTEEASDATTPGTTPDAATPTSTTPSGDDSGSDDSTSGGSGSSGGTSIGGDDNAADEDIPAMTAGSITKIKVNQGDTVRFTVTSDTAQEVHVHGYDKKYDVAAGQTKTISFPATLTGIYEVEFEGTSTQIGEITVEP